MLAMTRKNQAIAPEQGKLRTLGATLANRSAVYRRQYSFDQGVRSLLAELPEHIRGFGHVKLRHVEQVQHRRAELLTALRRPADGSAAA